MPVSLIDSRHCTYDSCASNWVKWRLTSMSGDAFIKQYLKKYSKRESDTDFNARLSVSYVPAFAKAALKEIKDAIFQRMVDISRVGGSDSYQQSVKGLNGGVDNENTDMNTFIGEKILPEMLSMREVGVFVDMPSEVGATLADSMDMNPQPYIYKYNVEDILNYSRKRVGNSIEFTEILLRDYEQVPLEGHKLPSGVVKEICRHLWIDQETGFVNVEFIDDEGKSGGVKVLQIKKIPFVLAEIEESLLVDVANYQIALLNLASSDLMYTLLSNFPFYTEQDDGINLPSHLKNPNTDGSTEPPAREIKVGHTVGRTYKDKPPQFINPSPEPLQVSMEKQRQMQTEIRQLVQLAVTNLQPKMASAESKSYDVKGLEAGLSCIGLELQRVERKIAEYRSAYLQENLPEITYPKTYSLKTDSERLEEAKEISSRINDAPSLTYKRELAKQITTIMLSGKVPNETIGKIYKEIDAAPTVINDPQMLQVLMQFGTIDNRTVAGGQGLPPSVVDKAEEEHATRLKRIQDAQTSPTTKDPANRGLKDLSSNPGEPSK